ncbi:MAG: hypothetical protein KUG78_20415 [Kangiellaceae bacterium]|nr:hypothetical protein [Kangiellaceae bacterium]
MMLSDEQFISEFEAMTLEPQYFSHRGHIRISWLYLNQFNFDLACEKIEFGINRYATSLGAKDKFHCTLTRVLVVLIYGRMKKSSHKSWQNFIINNSDLVNNAQELISEYYSEELINSELARKLFVKPDKNVLQ